MKRLYLLFLIIPFSFGCSSSYKTLQTPDDVYYSPGFYINHSSSDTKKDSSLNNNSHEVFNTTYHREYDDAYYYNRRRRYYDNDDYVVFKTKPNKISGPRTTNINAWKPDNNTGNVNPKISGIPARNPANTTSSGHAIRTFKRSGNTVIGNVVKALIGGSGKSNIGPISSSNNTNTNRPTTNSSSPSKSSSSAPVRSFEKKNN